MSAQFVQNGRVRPTSPPQVEDNPLHWTHNPELLHWRADVLLDEMMLGAVDLAAAPIPAPLRTGDSSAKTMGVPSTFSRSGGDQQQTPAGQMDPQPLAASSPFVSAIAPAANSALYTNGRQEPYALREPAAAARGRPDPLPSPRTEHSGVERIGMSQPTTASAPASAHPADWENGARNHLPANYWQTANDWQKTAAPEPQPGQTTTKQEAFIPHSALPGAEPAWRQTEEHSKPYSRAAGPMSANSNPNLWGEQRKTEQPNPEQWLFAAEKRYQQLSHPPGAPPLSSPPSTTNHTAMNASKSTEPNFHTYSLSDQMTTQVARGYGSDRPSPSSRPRDDYTVNRVPGAGFESVSNYTSGGSTTPEMGNMVQRSAKRSNLLPRRSSGDERAIQHEIASLYNEVENRLPAGHESRERAHYLLQKAQTILKKDATRSAEVDYYIQQVRTILGRIQETLVWSNLYQTRLRTYLLGWAFLSILILLARYLYQTPLTLAFSQFANVEPSSLFFQNYLAALGGFFGGALGGAIGTFYEMQQQTQRERSFFDRKYGLRGLILPLLSALVGLVVTAILAILYWILNQDPYHNLLLGTLPACIAFAFGMMQETIYGIRD